MSKRQLQDEVETLNANRIPPRKQSPDPYHRPQIKLTTTPSRTRSYVVPYRLRHPRQTTSIAHPAPSKFSVTLAFFQAPLLLLLAFRANRTLDRLLEARRAWARHFLPLACVLTLTRSRSIFKYTPMTITITTTITTMHCVL